jgi:RNA polymerase sigma-70 factor (ECF subfamily)
MSMNNSGDPASGFAQRVDAATLARAQSGDMQAFATLYATFGRPCFNLALRILGNHAQAEDLVQEVFLKMFGTIRSYRGDAPFGSWLKRMAVNATIDQLRSQRHEAGADAETLLLQVAASDSGGPAAALDAWSLLQKLPARARAILLLHEYEGYTHAELAELFGQSESYSKSVLARAFKRLHDQAETTTEADPCPKRS